MCICGIIFNLFLWSSMWNWCIWSLSKVPTHLSSTTHMIWRIQSESCRTTQTLNAIRSKTSKPLTHSISENNSAALANTTLIWVHAWAMLNSATWHHSISRSISEAFRSCKALFQLRCAHKMVWLLDTICTFNLHRLQVGGVTGYVTTSRQTAADLDKLNVELLFFILKRKSVQAV